MVFCRREDGLPRFFQYVLRLVHHAGAAAAGTLGLPIGFCVVPFQLSPLIHGGKGALLQFRVIPDSGVELCVRAGPRTFALQLIDRPVGLVFYGLPAPAGRACRRLFCGKLRFVRGLYAHIFTLCLADLAVYGKPGAASGPLHGFCYGALLTARTYLFLKMQRMPHPAIGGVKLALQAKAALLWQRRSCLFQLFVERFRLFCGSGGPLLR